MTDPRFEHMRRYTPTMRPYVEVTEGDWKTHAQVIGWVAGEIFIEYPLKAPRGPYPGPYEVKWVSTSLATRIRWADSAWTSTEDDFEWHKEQDKKITYRTDPWTIYTHDY